MIKGLGEFPYQLKLKETGLLSLKRERLHSDLIEVIKKRTAESFLYQVMIGK